MKKKLTKKQENILLLKNIKFCDYLVWACFIMFILVRVLTLIYLSNVVEVTGAQIEAVHTLYEANPLVKMTLQLNNLGNIIQFLMIPALLITTYFYYRKKILNREMDITSLSLFINMFFFMMLLNVFNDLALLLGKMI